MITAYFTFCALTSTAHRKRNRTRIITGCFIINGMNNKDKEIFWAKALNFKLFINPGLKARVNENKMIRDFSP
jgi:hypothetical protein